VYSEDLDAIGIMVATVFGVAGIMTLAPTLQRVFSALPAIRTQAYRGVTDPREVEATETLKWIDLVSNPPYTPWISAFLINDGPDAVAVGINYPDNRFMMNLGDTITVNRSWASERIAVIFFICPEGRAKLRIIGEY